MNRSVDVKCPFYVGGNSKSVSCEGIMTAESIVMRFRDQASCVVHTEEYCNDDFEECKFYKEIMKKYE